MKNRSFGYQIVALILSLMIIFLSGCDSLGSKKVVIEPMEPEDPCSLSFDFIGGKDVMPISGYYGPLDVAVSKNGEDFPDYFSDKMFELISGCGVNMFHHTYANYVMVPNMYEKMFELGEKYGVGIGVFDSEINSRGNDATLSLEAMDERLNLYRDYPAFVGMYVVDEPGSPMYKPEVGEDRYIERYQNCMKRLGELGVFGSLNMLPADEGEKEINKFLDYYCQNYNPMNLSWDLYVFQKDYTIEHWYYNVDRFRHYGLKYNLPVWVYVQAGDQWSFTRFDSDPYYPNEFEFDWNVNVLLATGVKGIEYYPLIQPTFHGYAVSTEYDFQRNSLIGAAMNKTQWWYYAKDINAHIAAIDSVLMNSVNKGVIITSPKAKKDTRNCTFTMKGSSWRELKSIEGETFTGCFNYQGKTALYVVNYDTKYAQKITLNLYDSYNMKVIQGTEESFVKTNKLKLDMKAGEGVLVVFE